MDKKYIIGIDEGTTSTRAILYDTKTFKIVDKEQIKFEQIFPFPSWVEQNASDVYKKVELTLNTIIKRNNLTCDNVYGIAITNQRETVVAWDRTSGKPIYNAIGWQCRRTSEYCKRLKNKTAIKNIRINVILLLGFTRFFLLSFVFIITSFIIIFPFFYNIPF